MNTLRLKAAAVLAVLAFAGCDNAGPVAEGSAHADAAAIIANALALDSGGALDSAVSAAEEADALVSGEDANRAAGDGSCTRERTYDDSAQKWIQEVECTRGHGRAFAHYTRTRAYQFLAGDGSVVPNPSTGFEMLNFEILSGTGLRTRPGFHNELHEVNGAFVVENLDGGAAFRFNGGYHRVGSDSLYDRAVPRMVDYTLDLTALDLQGPRGLRNDMRDGWSRAVSGLIEGTFDAVTTFYESGGTRSEPTHLEFSITFGEGSEDEALARIHIGDQVFVANVVTGTLQPITTP